MTAERRIDWARFFALPNAPPPQPSRRLGPRLVAPLMRLPEVLVGQPERAEFASLASRDLYRGHAVQLPSGEAVARAMGVTPCLRGDLRAGRVGSSGETPLWLYILAEAEHQQAGERLGEVGGRIVGEVLIELLKHDPTSYLSAVPTWQPELANERGAFGIVDLLQYAGVV